MEPIKVIIDRAHWMCSKRRTYEVQKARKCKSQKHLSLLYNPHSQTFCCLGFAALSCGYTKESILKISNPMALRSSPIVQQLARAQPDSQQLLRERYLEITLNGGDNKEVTYNLIDANDRIDSDNERELKIIELGREAGFEFEFTGEYPWKSSSSASSQPQASSPS